MPATRGRPSTNQMTMIDMPNLKGDKVQIRALHVREQSEVINPKFEIVSTVDQLKEISELAYAAGTIGYDCETRGLTRFDKVVSLGIGIGDRGFMIPTRMVHAFRNFETHEIREHLGDMLSSPRVNKVMHFGKFDSGHAFREYDLDIEGFSHDTGIAQWVLNENEPHDLESVCEKWLGMKQWKIKQDGSFDKFPMKVATNYQCWDAVAVLRLQEFQNEYFEKLPKLKRLFFDTEMPYINIAYRMEKRGMAWDQEYYETVMKPFVISNYEKYRDEVCAVLGNINLNSQPQVAAALFDGLKLPEINGRSVAKQVLAALGKMHPVIKSMQEHNKYSTLKKLYVDKLPDFIESGRIHTTIKTIGTVTGRSSATSPNLQHLPKKAIGPLIRRAFVPSPGHVLVAMDFSQIELRILAHLSQDKRMVQAFFSGEDFHSLTAHGMFGVPMAEMDPKQGGDKDLPQRITSKIINFGIPYGMGGQKLMDTINGEILKLDRADLALMTKDGAYGALDLWAATYKEADFWLRLQERLAKKNGYVETLLGRKRRLPNIYSDNPAIVAGAKRQAGNAPIQGSAADIFKVASIKLDEVIRKNRWPYHAMLAVHDEWIAEVRQDWLMENRGTLEVLASTMRHAVDLSVPIEVSVDILSRWGDKVDLDAVDIDMDEELEAA